MDVEASTSYSDVNHDASIYASEGRKFLVPKPELLWRSK
jgi:hypothetical protein